MDDNTFYEFCRMGPCEASKSLQSQPAMHEAFISKLLFMFCPYGNHEDQRMDIEETATELQGVPFVSWLLWLCTSPKPDETGDEYVRRVQDAFGARSNVCGRIWAKGYIAY
eukprot:CAMPEP_0172160462 /NCGR_PEP_ID=MMETSP1050-20130122/5569_1 /TAXON_ID=233186 /ORGANISM="Cryptomonas curvata, Strain CCAP979/52" /LENGTH=110 /DNA_ID=CAMNT_0012830223 /DNA_START=98 /DNA_END=427 /DNA_ORIENTATION=+